MTPRPLPLFLDMVRTAAMTDPVLARRALAGVRRYGEARRSPRPDRAVVATCGRVRLLAHGSSGPPLVMVPSLINPSHVLDLDRERSLLSYLGDHGFSAMVLDWGTPGSAEVEMDIGGHVSSYIVPLLQEIGEPVHLIGYCLGGTMAIAAAQHVHVRSLTLLATPWHYLRYPDASRSSLSALWARHRESVLAMGALPMEVLQQAFWGLDPERTVRKYADLADKADDDPAVTRFAALEDWSNSGAPLPAAAACDLFERFIGADEPGRGLWRVGGTVTTLDRLTAPRWHFVARKDRIAPAEAAPFGIGMTTCPSGHVGMIAVSRAISGCFEPVTAWLRSI